MSDSSQKAQKSSSGSASFSCPGGCGGRPPAHTLLPGKNRGKHELGIRTQAKCSPCHTHLLSLPQALQSGHSPSPLLALAQAAPCLAWVTVGPLASVSHIPLQPTSITKASGSPCPASAQTFNGFPLLFQQHTCSSPPSRMISPLPAFPDPPSTRLFFSYWPPFFSLNILSPPAGLNLPPTLYAPGSLLVFGSQLKHHLFRGVALST